MGISSVYAPKRWGFGCSGSSAIDVLEQPITTIPQTPSVPAVHLPPHIAEKKLAPKPLLLSSSHIEGAPTSQSSPEESGTDGTSDTETSSDSDSSDSNDSESSEAPTSWSPHPGVAVSCHPSMLPKKKTQAAPDAPQKFTFLDCSDTDASSEAASAPSSTVSSARKKLNPTTIIVGPRRVQQPSKLTWSKPADVYLDDAEEQLKRVKTRILAILDEPFDHSTDMETLKARLALVEGLLPVLRKTKAEAIAKEERPFLAEVVAAAEVDPTITYIEDSAFYLAGSEYTSRWISTRKSIMKVRADLKKFRMHCTNHFSVKPITTYYLQNKPRKESELGTPNVTVASYFQMQLWYVTATKIFAESILPLATILDMGRIAKQIGGHVKSEIMPLDTPTIDYLAGNTCHRCPETGLRPASWFFADFKNPCPECGNDLIVPRHTHYLWSCRALQYLDLALETCAYMAEQLIDRVQHVGFA